MPVDIEEIGSKDVANVIHCSLNTASALVACKVLNDNSDHVLLAQSLIITIKVNNVGHWLMCWSF